MVTRLIECGRCEEVFEVEAKDIFDTKARFNGRWFCDECSTVLIEREWARVAPRGIGIDPLRHIRLRI